MDLIETIKSALKGRLHNTTLPLFPTKKRLNTKNGRQLEAIGIIDNSGQNVTLSTVIIRVWIEFEIALKIVSLKKLSAF